MGKVMDSDGFRHKLQKVTLHRNDVFCQCLVYFEQFPENEEWFNSELTDLAWRNKFVGEFRNHISLTAVPLATKIYKQLNIITFPFIQRIACRGWDTSGGTWAWAMDTVSDGQERSNTGSADSPKYLLRKKVKLYLLESLEIVGDTE